MNNGELVSGPFVRIVGEGCDVMINVCEIDDIDIAHKAIDLAFTRYKKLNQPTTTNPDNKEN